ncbi:MAG TPA: glycosyl transferase family 2 [Methylomirabilota bacterium]|nr:glycosyl transferase family 2 [Methylomirabilota bacterium]
MPGLLPPATEGQVRAIGTADLVVGIPSYNNAGTIGHVARAAAAGLAKYFPGAKAVIVNSDGGSSDGTPQAVLEADLPDLRTVLVTHAASAAARISTPYHGIPGKGSAFRTIFQVADLLEARACAVVDSDLRSITPEWMELLLRPILDGDFDYVAPYYHRHKYDGTITNGIVYPLTRALYGRRIRQPIGGDFGFSGELARVYLAKPVWETDVARFGIDIWMTTTAVAERFRVCQAYLGAKIHDAKDPGADLTAMMTQVVGSCFGLLETYETVWPEVHGSEPVPLVGFPHAVGVDPVPVNLERLVSIYAQGVRDLGDIWRRVLPAPLRLTLAQALTDDPWRFHLPDPVWAEVVYRFALAHRRREVNREHLLGSLIPLYLGRTASFVVEMQSAGPPEVEARVEQLALVFEALKPLLVAEWPASDKEVSS